MDHVEELDFFSLAFNPLRALYEPGIRPPVENARPLDNLHQCRRLLPAEHTAYLPPRPSQHNLITSNPVRYERRACGIYS